MARRGILERFLAPSKERVPLAITAELERGIEIGGVGLDVVIDLRVVDDKLHGERMTFLGYRPAARYRRAWPREGPPRDPVSLDNTGGREASLSARWR